MTRKYYVVDRDTGENITDQVSVRTRDQDEGYRKALDKERFLNAEGDALTKRSLSDDAEDLRDAVREFERAIAWELTRYWLWTAMVLALIKRRMFGY